MRSAMRTTLRIAGETGLLAPGTTDLVPLFADDEAICTIAGEMFARRQRPKRDGHLDPRAEQAFDAGVHDERCRRILETAERRVPQGRGARAFRRPADVRLHGRAAPDRWGPQPLRRR